MAFFSRFVILDTRGVSTWSNTHENVERHVTFPKYQNRLLRFILFCEKHHVYFAICNDFTLQVGWSLDISYKLLEIS